MPINILEWNKFYFSWKNQEDTDYTTQDPQQSEVRPKKNILKSKGRPQKKQDIS